MEVGLGGTARSAPSVEAVVARARTAFADGVTRPRSWRRGQLDAMEAMLLAEDEAILGALRTDLGRPAHEAYLSEIASVLGEIRFLRRRLGRLSRPRGARLPLALRPGRAVVVAEPLGIVAVIAPWNYPVNLVLAPMAAALAAGNAVVAKPSELAPATSALLADLVARYLDPRAIGVVEGDGRVAADLVAGDVDHVFFTGSVAVGRVVMAAAATRPVPVILELGGKSPVIVGRNADLASAARRIVWGKCFNAGQTCIAPDYVLVERIVAEAFTNALGDAVARFYGDEPKNSADFGRIVNDAHLRRLVGLLDNHGGSVVVGGTVDEDERYVAPTVVYDVDPHSPLMEEEVFGPVLPVLPVESLDDAVAFVSARPTPLTMALFVGDRRTAERIIGRTRSGSVTVNTTLEHFAAPGLPFGGLGGSGFGTYHGEAGFSSFTHRRAILRRPRRPEVMIAYPPMTARRRKMLRRLV